MAAYVVAAALGWPNVPPTVLRDGPEGRARSSCSSSSTLAALLHAWRGSGPTTSAGSRLFDVVVNNADRKSGHCLLGDDGTIWSIDHGVCFHDEPKLRTVIWEFVGEPIPDQLCADLDAAGDRARAGWHHPAPSSGTSWPNPRWKRTAERLGRLLTLGRFPEPEPGVRPFPWPPI